MRSRKSSVKPGKYAKKLGGRDIWDFLIKGSWASDVPEKEGPFASAYMDTMLDIDDGSWVEFTASRIRYGNDGEEAESFEVPLVLRRRLIEGISQNESRETLIMTVSDVYVVSESMTDAMQILGLKC